MSKEISLTYEVAVRAMSMIVNQGRLNHLETIGLSNEDFKKVTSDVPWTGQDRNRVTAALNTLMSGVLDTAGVPRFALPAEWVAACIAVFVSPINVSLACCYVERPGSAAEIGSGEEEFEKCTAKQLFSLIVQFHGGIEHVQARLDFERKTKLRIDSLTEEQRNGEKNAKKI